ncbi:hypothetical protein ACFVP3_00700 [Streptomyces sp. NPDC057806]
MPSRAAALVRFCKTATKRRPVVTDLMIARSEATLVPLCTGPSPVFD